MRSGQGRASARPQGLALTRALEPIRLRHGVNAMHRLAFTLGSILRPLFLCPNLPFNPLALHFGFETALTLVSLRETDQVP